MVQRGAMVIHRPACVSFLGIAIDEPGLEHILALRLPSSALNESSSGSSLQRRLYTVLAVLLIAGGTHLVHQVRRDDNNAGHSRRPHPASVRFPQLAGPRATGTTFGAPLFDQPAYRPPITAPRSSISSFGRVYLWGPISTPARIFLILMLVTINVALVSTIVGFIGGISFCFIAARNYFAVQLAPRIPVKRVMELFRAFPEIVIAGMFAAIISIGPVAAIIAISIHCIGALGKLFYEVIENIDMRGPDEGLKARRSAPTGSSACATARCRRLLPGISWSYTLLRLEINVQAPRPSLAPWARWASARSSSFPSRAAFGAKTIALVLLLFVTI